MSLSKKVIIAVDGPAGSGKSSVSKEVAKMMDLKYVDSGAIYRAITWFFLENYDSITADIEFEKSLPGLEISQIFEKNGESFTYVNGKDVSGLIRNELIAKNIGVISDDVKIRNFVNDLLRGWSENESLIMDGRDIGTVVLPGADLKIFLDANVEIRAERRIKEYKEMGKDVDEKTIEKQIIQRDNEDKSRPFGALRRADDAVYIDTSVMDKGDVINKIKLLIEETIK